jgi:hypothetical protein
LAKTNAFVRPADRRKTSLRRSQSVYLQPRLNESERSSQCRLVPATVSQDYAIRALFTERTFLCMQITAAFLRSRRATRHHRKSAPSECHKQSERCLPRRPCVPLSIAMRSRLVSCRNHCATVLMLKCNQKPGFLMATALESNQSRLIADMARVFLVAREQSIRDRLSSFASLRNL